MMTRAARLATVLASGVVVSLLGAASSGATTSASGDDLSVLRGATAGFHRTEAATSAGYGPFPEGTPLRECIDVDLDLDDADGAPGMGFHWVNGDLVDATIDAAEPEVLVYEPTKNGRLRLVAVEYVVFADVWGVPGTTAPPNLFGHDFTFVGEPNRYGLPAFYALHAWVWKHNPAGTFADFNPKVTCSHADAAD